MMIYHYHPLTREFLGAGEARKDPERPGHFLIPADSTASEPPELGASEGSVAQYDRETGEWTAVPDCRGTVYWTPEGERHQITELGEEPPEGALDAPPPPSPEELASKARQRRNGLLRATDWTQLADAQLRLGPELVAAYEAYRQALADVPQQGGFPEAIEWPEAPESA